ncbi:MAG TPA: Na+/H+ antiporter subunit E [Devosiaceae bacterium]|nr:Na+/H+ antiporter subunit E [Devosiaceae bacterium]
MEIIAFKRFMLLALLWLVLTTAATDGLWLGLLAAVGATWVSLVLIPPGKPVKLLALMRMLPGFVWRSLLGGVDVAWRALHPRMPLKPGWLLLPTALPEGPSRVALGSEFSLLPGTLVAGTRDGMLLVHCLDMDQPVERAVRREEDEIGAAIGLRPLRDLPPKGRLP